MIFALALSLAFAAPTEPLFRDFMGLNGHTVLFKPELYRPVARHIRDYHEIEWDLGDDTSRATRFPFARNGVNWEDLYKSWIAGGCEPHVSLSLGALPKLSNWKDVERDAFAYGFSFARFFGPSSEFALVPSVEVGNELPEYTDAEYRRLFEAMARGLRQGDPKLKILPCAVLPGSTSAYLKDTKAIEGLESLYDALNVHVYSFIEEYPTWKRAHPEDRTIKTFLREVEDTIAWRNANAPGKPVWVTEFGWDSTTKPNKTEGDFAKWVGNTDLEQAQYLVRSFLIFSSMDVERAYIYFFNDDDEPSLHASSGITRGYEPKPSYHAVAQMQRLMGDYRFERKVLETSGANVFEFSHENDGTRVWAIWSPTRGGQSEAVELAFSGTVLGSEAMATTAGEVPSASVNVKEGKLRTEASESPVYVRFRP